MSPVSNAILGIGTSSLLGLLSPVSTGRARNRFQKLLSGR